MTQDPQGGQDQMSQGLQPDQDQMDQEHHQGQDQMSQEFPEGQTQAQNQDQDLILPDLPHEEDLNQDLFPAQSHDPGIS